ncbi:MAG: hypothetical protein U0871_28405 [Gemmataceae bacterium]
MPIATRVIAVLATVFLTAGPTLGQYTWTGASGNVWSDLGSAGANWSVGGSPAFWAPPFDLNKQAIFPASGANQSVVLGSPIELSDIQFTGGAYTINLNGRTLTLNGSAGAGLRSIAVSSGITATLAGAGGVTTTGGNLVKTGAGTLLLGFNSGTFLTTSTGVIEIRSGAIQTAGSASALNTTTSVILGSGVASGELVLGSGTNADAQTLVGLTTAGTGTANRVYTGSSVGTSNLTLTIAGGTTNTFGGVLGGSTGNQASLNTVFGQSGAGVATIVLNGANLYTGTTLVNSNTRLRIGNATALGADAGGGVSVSNGATLELNGQTVGAKAVTITGAGATGAGAALLNNSGTAASLAGTVTLAGGSGNAVGGSGNLTLSGPVTGSGRLDKVGTGVLILSNSGNNYGGGTTIAGGGTVRMGADNALSNQGLGLNGGTLSSGAAAGFSGSFGPLSQTATSTLALGTGDHTLTFTTLSYTGGTLTVNGWTGLMNGTGTSGKLVFTGLAGDPNTTFASFLSNVTFTGADTSGNTFLAGGAFIPSGVNYELVPAPEPATCLAVSAAGLGLAGFVRRRLAGRPRPVA